MRSNARNSAAAHFQRCGTRAQCASRLRNPQRRQQQLLVRRHRTLYSLMAGAFAARHHTVVDRDERRTVVVRGLLATRVRREPGLLPILALDGQLPSIPNDARVAPHSIRFPVRKPKVVSLRDDCGTSSPRRLNVAIRPAIEPPVTTCDYFFRLVVKQCLRHTKEVFVESDEGLTARDQSAIGRENQNITRRRFLEDTRIAGVLRASELIMESANRGDISSACIRRRSRWPSAAA